MNTSKKYSLAIYILAAVVTLYACKKSDTPASAPAPEPATAEKVKLQLRLSGDITIDETPLPGARIRNNGNYVYARTLEDSTIYAVDVRTGNWEPYAAGVFNWPDNIVIEVPKGTYYTISVAAFKRGTGVGLWWTTVAGGYQYFERPLDRPLKNEMSYSTVPGSIDALSHSFLDTLSNMTVRGTWYDNAVKERFYYSELDTYFGTAGYNAGDSAVILNIPLKRVSFGIRYNVTNFNGGRLIADYNYLMKARSFTPQNITDSSFSIYTADTYRWSDSLYSWEQIPLTLTWEKPDGSTQVLGSKVISPKRNSLTTVNVTLPPLTGDTGNVGVDIRLTDTTWLGNNTVDF
ncbi:hypothetical protein [Chitinophaga japonensis]|uniref:Fimbrillin-A associated anchor protein Mfa1/Mfa2 n=1 Tax=Chitinophaga japonensis TaxID=104662 RepID=A0A562TC57_CHIJA|nr:hypothetical protein [Chitinophaga japonensis]TWI91137.1 hypothetical protein LX66_0499 [Chitinophaga japonensis]